MKNLILILLAFFLLSSCSLFHEPKVDPLDTGEIWASAYLASWNHRVAGTVNGKTWGNLVTEDIDWDAITHLFYFSLTPNPDGSLPEVIDYENVNPDRLNAIVEAAHQNNTPILMTFGGYNTRDVFMAATADSSRQNLIVNMVDFINTWGFDGIDLDIQPLQPEDANRIVTFVEDLHAALQNHETPLLDKPILTATTPGMPEIYSQIQHQFDQINIATYDMSRPFQGWRTWHNTPLYNGGHTFSFAGDIPLPSIENKLQDFLDAGINRKKLGISASFYGYEWSGVTEPLEEWEADNVPTVPFYGGTPYFDLYEEYNLENYLWDKDAKVPYLSINEPPTFVSFDNSRSIREKLKFIREEGLGGIMVWELAGGFLEDAEVGQRDELLQSIKEGLHEFEQSNAE